MLQSSIAKKFAMLLAVTVVTAITVSAQSAEYLVKYKTEQTVNKIISMQTESSGLLVQGLHRPGKLLKVDIQERSKIKVLAQIYSDKNVEYVVPNFKIRAYTAPVNAQALKDQYALTKVNAEKAWQRAGNKGSRMTLLAVIDTGVDYKHKNLASNMVPGFDFFANDNDPMDETGMQNPGHGTHCAGVIGATGFVDGGIQGISPDISVMPLRFLGADGGGDLNNAIKSIDYAIQKKVSVISASWGATVPLATAKPLVEAVERADKAGIIFVTAAANDGKNNDATDVFPANASTPNMIIVAASDKNDAKPSWSNYGKAKVSLAAPGDAIMSTLPNDSYGELSGTSMATPLVAGLVAFLKSQDPTLTGAEIRSLLQTTGAKVAIETACNCRVDALSATETLLSHKPWIVPAAASIAAKSTLQMTMKNAQGTAKFESSNPSVASVTEAGLVTGVNKGTVIITATDTAGNKVSSLDINVGASSGGGGGGGSNPGFPWPDPGNPGNPNPGNPGNPNPGNPGNPGSPIQCPWDPQTCQLMCMLLPDMPWCTP